MLLEIMDQIAAGVIPIEALRPADYNVENPTLATTTGDPRDSVPRLRFVPKSADFNDKGYTLQAFTGQKWEKVI